MQKPYSDKTAQIIDEEVKKFVDMAYIRTKELLMENKTKLEQLAKQLLDKEVIFREDLERIFGKRPFDKEEEAVAEVITEEPKQIVTPPVTPPAPENTEPPANTLLSAKKTVTPEVNNTPENTEPKTENKEEENNSGKPEDPKNNKDGNLKLFD